MCRAVCKTDSKHLSREEEPIHEHTWSVFSHVSVSHSLTVSKFIGQCLFWRKLKIRHPLPWLKKKKPANSKRIGD